MRRPNNIFIHLTVWITYIIIAIFVYGYKKENWSGYIFETTISHVVSAGIFYTTALYIFPKFWDKKKYFRSILLLLIVLSGSIALRLFFGYVISPYILHTKLSISTFDLDELLLKFFFQWFTFSLYSLGYWQATSRLRIQRELSQNKEIEAKQKTLELENAALRAQINPHFIFNTLEHLRNQTAESDPIASYSMGCFMQILRAGMITPGPDGKIPLKVETDAIEGTVFIFKQRFPNISLTHISEINDIASVRIMPHILVPFVENAFKHGAYDDGNSKISIELIVKNGTLKLFVFNKKGMRIKDQSRGIGLRYVKRHLESGYKNNHHLIITEAEENFTVDLTIHLN